MTETQGNVPVIDVERLAKLMMMTTSNFDGEALVAMRKANSMLTASKRNWQDILLARPEPQRQQERPRTKKTKTKQEDPRAPLINKMFAKLFETVAEGSTFREFVDSVHSHWVKKGVLSEKQYAAIHRAYQNATKDDDEED